MFGGSLQAPNNPTPKSNIRLNSYFTRFNQKFQKYKPSDLPQSDLTSAFLCGKQKRNRESV
jgi:hypothetical protein